MGGIINTALYCEFIVCVDILQSSLRTQSHGMGLKERRGFWNFGASVGHMKPPEHLKRWEHCGIKKAQKLSQENHSWTRVFYIFIPE